MAWMCYDRVKVADKASGKWRSRSPSTGWREPAGPGEAGDIKSPFLTSALSKRHAWQHCSLFSVFLQATPTGKYLPQPLCNLPDVHTLTVLAFLPATQPPAFSCLPGLHICASPFLGNSSQCLHSKPQFPHLQKQEGESILRGLSRCPPAALF